MSLTNTSKPSNTVTNSNKVASYETWATATTTWATETRTWAEMGSLMDNISRVTAAITNIAKPV